MRALSIPKTQPFTHLFITLKFTVNDKKTREEVDPTEVTKRLKIRRKRV